jgi:hypothetical protein
MRTLIINLLAMALLLLGASSASAVGFTMNLNPGSISEGVAIAPSDTIIVDVYMDADIFGLGFAAVAVIYDDNSTLAYQPTIMNMPSYILYTPPAGTSTATYLYPNVNPPNIWNGINVPGKRQVTVEYLGNGFANVTQTGSNIWIATLVFHVTNPGVVAVDLTLNAGGTIVNAYGNDFKGSATATGSYVFGVPEPTTAVLIGFGLVGLTIASRRKD